MSTNYSFPRADIQVIDKSSYLNDGADNDRNPFHYPLFLVQAKKGPTDIVEIKSTDVAYNIYGGETFDSGSKYFILDNLFVKNCLRNNNSCMIKRIVPDDSVKSTLLLECYVSEDMVPQYSMDQDGFYILDNNGEKIPLLDSDGSPIKSLGLSISWKTRILADDESIDSAIIVLKDHNGKQATVYPVLAFSATSVGEYGNSLGFILSLESSKSSSHLVKRVGSRIYRFSATDKNSDNDLSTPITTKFNYDSIECVLRPNITDVATSRRLSLDYQLSNSYIPPLQSTTKLPYDFHIFYENIEIINNRIMDIEKEKSIITSPWLVDMLTCKNVNDSPYKLIMIDNADNEIRFIPKHNIYLKGGGDGVMDREAFESKVREFFELKTMPELINLYRYQFTTLYDPGYSIKTKLSMITLLGKIDDIVLTLSTQDMSIRPNTKEEEYSVGTMLSAALLLQAESFDYGTNCCRGHIISQSGKLINDIDYTGNVPLTLEILKFRCTYQNGKLITGSPGGSDTAQVRLIKDFNWAPNQDDESEIFWSAGINYAQYFNSNSLFYPSIRSVYPNQSSVLGGYTYIDILCCVKRILRTAWALTTGISTLTESDLFSSIESTCKYLYHERVGIPYKFSPTAYRTEEDNNLGNTYHIDAELTGVGVANIAKITIIALRENFTQN